MPETNAPGAASAITAGAVKADPYAAQVAEYMATGVPVGIPKVPGRFELPYTGPVLTRDGLKGLERVRAFDFAFETEPDFRMVSRERSASAPPIPWGHPRPTSNGEVRMLYLLCESSSNPQKYSSAEATEKIFGDNAGHTSPSVVDYYRENSHGNINVTGDVLPTEGAYSSNYNPFSDQFGAWINEILGQMYDDGVRLRDYDGNGDGHIDGITFILSENIRAFVGHSYLQVNNDADIISFGYLGEDDMAPESNTAHHELGHFFYLPDYYDLGGDMYGPSPGPDGTECMGIGYWDLMCAGNYTNPPMPMSPLNKWILEWIEPNVVSVDSTGIVLNPSHLEENDSEIYLLAPGGSYTDGVTKEYFLLENRWVEASSYYGGYNPAWNPGRGLLIWHVDEDVWTSNYDSPGPNSIEEHKAIDLECADGITRNGYPGGYDDLDGVISGGNANPGDATDVYPRQGKEFAFTSVPSSMANDGSDTGIRVYNITKDNMAQTITLDVEVGNDGPPVVDIISPADGSEVSGYIEADVRVYGDIDHVIYAVTHDSGQFTETVESAPWSLTIPVTEFYDQTVTLGVAAVDSTARTGEDSVTVDVGPPPAPVVSITGPVNGLAYSGTVSVTVATEGAVQQVEYEVIHEDGTFSTVATAPPFSLNLATESFGNQRLTIRARAIDEFEQSGLAETFLDVYNNPGDTDNNGDVNSTDVNLIRNNLGTEPGDGTFRAWYDTDEDGIVTEADAALIGYYYGTMY
jgi:M6 family metalloprotease-like protein